MHLYLLGQCPELNFGQQLKLVILFRFKSFCPTLACTIPFCGALELDLSPDDGSIAWFTKGALIKVHSQKGHQ
jgi:hypothetical protein